MRLKDGDVLVRMVHVTNVVCQPNYDNRPFIRLNSGTYRSKKDNINASVDVVRLIRRDGHDIYEYLFDQIKNSNWSSFATIKVEDIREMGFSVIFTPSIGKPYHAEIVPRNGKAKISENDSRDLLKISIWQMKATGI